MMSEVTERAIPGKADARNIFSRYRVGRWFSWVLVVAILVCLAIRLHRTWEGASGYAWRFDGGTLALSVGVLLGYCAVLPWPWGKIVGALDSSLSFRQVFRLQFLSALGRYLPGTIWQYLGRVVLCERIGVPPAVTVASLGLETAFALLSAGLVWLLTLPWQIQSVGMVRWEWYLLLLPVGLLAVHPAVFGRMFNGGLRLLKRPPLQMDLTYRQVLGFVGLYVGLWFLFGLAFFLFARSLTPLGWNCYLPVTGVYALAWVIGMVSVFAPAGIGVREGVLSVLLAQYLPEPTAIVVALLSRLWVTLAELVCALVAWRL